MTWFCPTVRSEDVLSFKDDRTHSKRLGAEKLFLPSFGQRRGREGQRRGRRRLGRFRLGMGGIRKQGEMIKRSCRRTQGSRWHAAHTRTRRHTHLVSYTHKRNAHVCAYLVLFTPACIPRTRSPTLRQFPLLTPPQHSHWQLLQHSNSLLRQHPHYPPHHD